jgi:hypothetical protein
MALAGFLVWVITTKIPMDPIFRTIIYVVIAIALILFVARQFRGSIPNVLN